MIVSAAVTFKILKEDKEVTLPVHRHADAFQIMHTLGYKAADVKVVAQGFYKYVDGEEYEFLDRHAAADHAYDCGQLVETAEEPRIYTLFSEDLW